MLASSELVIVYDGDCPFCSRYVELVKMRETVDLFASSTQGPAPPKSLRCNARAMISMTE